MPVTRSRNSRCLSGPEGRRGQPADWTETLPSMTSLRWDYSSTKAGDRGGRVPEQRQPPLRSRAGSRIPTFATPSTVSATSQAVGSSIGAVNDTQTLPPAAAATPTAQPYGAPLGSPGRPRLPRRRRPASPGRGRFAAGVARGGPGGRWWRGHRRRRGVRRAQRRRAGRRAPAPAPRSRPASTADAPVRPRPRRQRRGGRRQGAAVGRADQRHRRRRAAGPAPGSSSARTARSSPTTTWSRSPRTAARSASRSTTAPRPRPPCSAPTRSPTPRSSRPRTSRASRRRRSARPTT